MSKDSSLYKATFPMFHTIMTPEQNLPATLLAPCTAEELRRRQIYYANLYEQQRKQLEKDAMGERQRQIQATEEQYLTARERRALSQRRRREQATEEQRQAARERDTLRQKLRRQQASEEQRRADRQREAENARRRRAEESDEQRRLRQEKNKLETRRRRKQEETDEERRAFQREIAALTQRLRRARQTDAQKQANKERSRLEQRRRRQEADEKKKAQQRELNTLTQRLRRATDASDRLEIQRQIDALKEKRRLEQLSLHPNGTSWTDQPTSSGSSGQLWREELSSVMDEDSYGVDSGGLNFKLEVVNFHRNNLPDVDAGLTARSFGLDEDVVQNLLDQEEFLRFQRTLFDTPAPESVLLQPCINQNPESQTLPLFFISSTNDDNDGKGSRNMLPGAPTSTPAVPREFSTEISDGYDLGFRLLVVNVYKLHAGNIERTLEWFRLFPIIIRNCWVTQEESLRRQLQVLSTATAQLDPSSANATRLKLDFNDLAFKLLVVSYYKANDKGDTTLTIQKFRLDENKILTWVAALAANTSTRENAAMPGSTALSTNVLSASFMGTPQPMAPSLVPNFQADPQQRTTEVGEENSSVKGPTAMV